MFKLSSATVLLSGKQYPKIHLGYRVMCKSEKELAKYKASNLANPKNPLAQTNIEPMIKKFEKYWFPMKEFLAILVVIDSNIRCATSGFPLREQLKIVRLI